MCLPAAVLIGAGLMAGGGLMQHFGQKKADKAMNNTFNRERARQKAFEKDQQGRFEDSLASTQGIHDPRAQAAAAQAREAEYAAATKAASDPAASGYLPGTSGGNAVIATAAERAGAESDAQTSQLAKSLATLGGLTDQMQTNDIRIGRNSQEIAQIGGFKAGSLRALQAEMDAAKLKGQTLRGLGSLAMQIGQMAAMSGAGGGGPMPVGGTFDPSLVNAQKALTSSFGAI